MSIKKEKTKKKITNMKKMKEDDEYEDYSKKKHRR